MVEELDGLKMQVRDELIAKTSQLDGEMKSCRRKKIDSDRKLSTLKEI